jgi:hypothetical protein
MANTLFSTYRFKRLIAAYFAENGRMLWRALIAFAVISISIWLIITSLLISNDEGFHTGLQVFLFVLMGFIFPILAAGWFYGRLNNPERQISFLVIPATHFEKHLLSTLMGLLVPLFAGIFIYMIGESICMTLHQHLADYPQWYYSNSSEFYGESLLRTVIEGDSTTLIFFYYFSFWLFAATYFQFFTLHFTRFALFKIVLLSLALFTIIALYIYLIFESSGISDNAPFRYVRHLYESSNNGVRNYESEGLLFAVPGLMSALVLWFCSYVRLKEFQLK